MIKGYVCRKRGLSVVVGDAATFSVTTLSIMPLGIMTTSIVGLIATA